MRNLINIASLILLASCTPNSQDSKYHLKNSSIINGVAIKDGEVFGSSVVAVYNIKEESICSGSLITPNIVMTAAHCAPARASNVKIIFASDVDSMMGALEPDVKDAHILQATDFRVGPTWDPNNTTREIDTGDIMLIKFKGELPEGYRPATMLSDSEARQLLKIGTAVTVAGYGVDNVDISKEINTKTFIDLEGAILEGEVTCDDDKNGNHIKCFKLQMSGDGILQMAEAPIGSIHETEINLDERKAGTCSGDSGGPAFIKKDDILYLFGVTSRGSELCNNAGVYTNALFYKTWINDTIKLLK
jgi:secreted trypsin-like serine protease